MSVAALRRALCGAIAAALLLSACTTSAERAGPDGGDTVGSIEPVPDPDVVYVYDALGRLRAVTVPEDDTAVYHYDAVGNRLAVDRYPSEDLSVIEVVPWRGSPGTEITLHGTGFAPDPDGNDVEFAGQAATVTASDTFELTVVVPEGAASGPVTVSTRHGSAASDEAFDVIEGSAPVVTAVHPTLIGPWDEVTIEGEGFTGDPLLDHVVIGDATYATVESASPTKLVVTVPPTATSGRVSVTTSDGTGHSGQDVFVTPWTDAVDIGAWARAAVGEPTTVSIAEPGGAALVAFEGTAGQLLSLRTEDGDEHLGCAELQFRVSGPGGVELARDATLTDWCGKGADRAVRLPADGTYALVAASRRGPHAGEVTVVLEDEGRAPDDDGAAPGDDDGRAATRRPTGGVLDGSDLLPIDLTSGRPVFAHTDLVVDDVVPIELTRTFEPITRRPAFPIHRRGFGIGSSWELDLELRLSSARQFADLVLPDGVAEIPFERVTPGADDESAVFRPQVRAASLPDGHIAWNGNGWDLTLESGTTLVFAARNQAPLVAVRDERGNTLTIERGEPTASRPGPITAIVSPSGRWVRFRHDDERRIVEAWDHLGTTLTYRYDDEGLLATVTSSERSELGYRYDDQRRVVAVTGDDGVVLVANEYDDDGRVVRQTLHDGSEYAFAYTTGEHVIEIADDDVAIEATTIAEVVDPYGMTRRLAFEGGYWTSDTHAVGTDDERRLAVERDPATGLTTAIIEPDGLRTEYGHDETGNTVRVVHAPGSPAEAVTILGYARNSNLLTSLTSSRGDEQSFTYDDAGNLVRHTGAGGATTTYDHDAHGRVTSVTQPDGRTTRMAYELGHRVTITDDGGRGRSEYLDAAGRLAARTDAAGNVTRFGYDAAHRIEAITDAAGGVTRFSYDEEGNLVGIRDAAANVTTYDYDDLHRVVSRADPRGELDRYAYDERGRLVEHVDRRGVRTTRGYDVYDRLSTVAYRVDENGEAESTIRYGYDLADRLVLIDDSDHGTIRFDYDDADRLVAEQGPLGETSYAYDELGRLTASTLPDGTGTRYGYDDLGRLTSISRAGLTVTATYDKHDRLRELDLPNDVVAAYGYDERGLLNAIRYRGATSLPALADEYDAVGRRVATIASVPLLTLPDPLADATYGPGNRLSTLGGDRMEYDETGNLVEDGTNSYTWDARGRLVAVDGPVAASFTYDPFGRRTTKTAAGVTTSYVYDGSNIAQERRSDGSVTTYLTGPAPDEVFARARDGHADTYLTDVLGSVVGLVGADGEVTAAYRYDPHGGTTVSGDAGGNQFAFTGRELDETGLYFYRNRYYDPASGRFVSEDPIGFEGGDTNLYAYVQNDPVNHVDPEGLQAVSPACGAAGGAALAYVGATFSEFADIMDPERGPDPFSEEARIALDHIYRQTWDVFWTYLDICGAPGVGGALSGGLGRTVPRVVGPGSAARRAAVDRTTARAVHAPTDRPPVPGSTRAIGTDPTGIGPGRGAAALFVDAAGVAHRRSAALQSALPAGSRGRVTMSAGVVEDAAGNRYVVIGTSEPNGYLRPGVREALQPGEIVVGGVGHAEANIVAWALARGYRVVSVGAGRPHCSPCVRTITGAGGSTASPRR